MRDQVLHENRKEALITFLYITVFMFSIADMKTSDFEL